MFFDALLEGHRERGDVRPAKMVRIPALTRVGGGFERTRTEAGSFPARTRWSMADRGWRSTAHC